MPESLVIASIVVAAVVTLAVVEAEVRRFLDAASRPKQQVPALEAAATERRAA